MDGLLEQLQMQGTENDALQQDKGKKWLNITPETGKFLALLVGEIQPTLILEIGTSMGYSTLWLARAGGDSVQVTTIERDEAKHYQAQQHLQQAGINNRIDAKLGDASDWITRLEGQFELIFLDADRSQYLSLAPRLFQLLKPQGMLVVDNALSHADEVAPFKQWLEQQPELDVGVLPIGKGELVAYLRE
ncbi:O-methyltransferase [Salinivibrio sp. ES.052]|uniref:O-methyltransferase n=1 Tax=Salinivibrio sp. ES.052 TaxID=1882823 RepID=UPI0009285CE5|nr:O-methyltransferase [Salinivibrio sp. ES.052]SIN88285.1 Predicted O-methyltransferase YrrM [Salinivibrio sp. ES.052]